ncbi:MAG: BrnT family toxin [Burkholderiaceae bacterium]
MPTTQFIWDEKKNDANLQKHHVSFQVAQAAFMDTSRVIARDLSHSKTEERFYCFGKVEGGVLTVRFTYRGNLIRIFGAGYWRKGKQIYDQENNLHE